MGQGLEEFLEEARANHPALQASYSNYQAMSEKVNQAGVLSDPVLSAGVFLLPVETRVGPQRFKLSLNQKLPWFGSLKAEKNVWEERSEVALEVYNAQWVEMEYKIVKSWYELNNTRQLIRYHQQLLSLYESLHSLALTKFESGTGSLANVLRTQMAIDQHKIQTDNLQDLQSARKTNFNLLVNRDREAAIDLPDTIASGPLVVLPYDSVVNHPRLRKIVKEQGALEAEGSLVKYKGRPGIGLGLDYVMVGERTDMAVADNGKDVIMPMVSLSLPIFRKKYRSMKDEIDLKIQSNESLRENELLSLRTEYELAEWNYQESVRNIGLYGELISKSEKVVELLITEFSVSGEYLNDILDVHEDILNYRIKQINAITESHVAAAKIKSLTSY